MTEYKKNHFNLLNLIGAALGAAATVSIASIFLNTMPVVATLVLAAVAISSFGIIQYDETTEVASKTGVLLVLIFILSLIGAATGIVGVIATQAGFIQPEAIENPIGKTMAHLVMLGVGTGIFLLGQVFEE